MADWRRVDAPDGHYWQVLQVRPASPRAELLWLPALGVAARHYEPFAHALAARGIAVTVHEWRGMGTSSVRASRDCNWGYHELLSIDVATTLGVVPGSHRDRIIGGHSLGGQLACCMRALDVSAGDRLWLVASGAPWFRAFPWPTRFWLPLAYRLLPWLADLCGALPGRRIGFGGQEARGVMRDWSRTALSGRYVVQAVGDIEAAMERVDAEADAVVLSQDWLAPRSSLESLLRRMPLRAARMTLLGATALGTTADHFAWMKQPAAVAEALVAGSFADTSPVHEGAVMPTRSAAPARQT